MAGTDQTGEQDKRDGQGSAGQAGGGAPNQGVSTPEPAEGADDAPGKSEGSPQG